jgi:hypothetical protein
MPDSTSDESSPGIRDLLARLDDGAGRPCLFEPPVGTEFGHEVITCVRMIHFHRGSEKIVCCRPGHEVLYPLASACITDWTDLIPDAIRTGTSRRISMEMVPQWPAIRARYPQHHIVSCRGLTLEQELYVICPKIAIPFRPKKRGLRADVLFGVRKRDLAAHRNWLHWTRLAQAASAAGLSFAVGGAKETSFDLAGQLAHSGDYDTDAAIELLQNCRLFVGTDSGASHLAAAVGAPMLIIGRNESEEFWNFTRLMMQVNPNPIEVVREAWNDPARIAGRMIGRLSATSG